MGVIRQRALFAVLFARIFGKSGGAFAARGQSSGPEPYGVKSSIKALLNWNQPTRIHFTYFSYVYSGNYNWNTGRLYNQSNNGNYWSSTVVSSTDAYNLNTWSSDVRPANTNNKANGNALRCVSICSASELSINPHKLWDIPPSPIPPSLIENFLLNPVRLKMDKLTKIRKHCGFIFDSSSH